MKEIPNSRFTITSNYLDICSEEVFSKLLPVLMTYAYSLIEDGRLKSKKSIGQLSYDFAMEAITRYLEEPSKFDPKRNKDLVQYLKYNTLRRLVSNAKTLKSYRNELLFEEGDTIHRKAFNAPVLDSDVHKDIDYSNAISAITKDLVSFPLLQEVFRLRIVKDYLRSEVCTKLNITSSDYDNRMRRIKTIAKKRLTSFKSSTS